MSGQLQFADQIREVLQVNTFHRSKSVSTFVEAAELLF